MDVKSIRKYFVHIFSLLFSCFFLIRHCAFGTATKTKKSIEGKRLNEKKNIRRIKAYRRGEKKTNELMMMNILFMIEIRKC